jgi:plastocyanin
MNQTGAGVSGNVTLRDSRDPEVRKNNNFSGVVVWLEPLTPTAAPPPMGRSVILQKNKRFSPHILAVPVGTTVDFPNADPIFHNAFSSFDGQIFDVGLYPPGSSKSVRFSRPGVVRVFCNIHAAMSAVIVVLNTSSFATTKADGAFRIANVPPGEYTLHVFHERATPATLHALERRVTVTAGALALPPFEISESGYLPLPHQNKYGREYPPAEDSPLYPGAKK